MLDVVRDGSLTGSTVVHERAKASALIIAEQGSRLATLPGLLAHCRDQALDTIVIAQQSDETGSELLGRVIRRLRSLSAHGRSLQTCIVLAGDRRLVERKTMMDAAFGYLSGEAQDSGLILIHADGASTDQSPLFEFAPKRPAPLRKCLAVVRSQSFEPAPAAASTEFEEFADIEASAQQGEQVPEPMASGVFPCLERGGGEEPPDADDEGTGPLHPAARHEHAS